MVFKKNSIPWNKGNKTYRSLCLYCKNPIFSSYKKKYCNSKCYFSSGSLINNGKRVGKLRLMGQMKVPYRMSWGYKYLLNHNHPRSSIQGYIGEHIIEMEKKLGRFLNKEEIAHHIDGNRANNNQDNLFPFPTRSKHTSYETNLINTYRNLGIKKKFVYSY